MALEDAKKFNATVKEEYGTLRQFDVAAIIDAPDEVSMNALLMSLATLGKRPNTR